MTQAKLVVSAAEFSRFLTLKAEASALEKEIKALEASFNFPSPDAFATSYSLTVGESGTALIVNGNGDTVGKFSVFHHAGAIIPPGWRKRIG